MKPVHALLWVLILDHGGPISTGRWSRSKRSDRLHHRTLRTERVGDIVGDEVIACSDEELVVHVSHSQYTCVLRYCPSNIRFLRHPYIQHSNSIACE